MTKLSRQDIYDIAHKYYADGGAVGVSKDGNGCIYFAPDGGHCGIGVILDHLGIEAGDLADEEHMNGTHNVDAHAMGIVEFLGNRLTDHLENDVYSYGPSIWDSFIMKLQSAHDRVAKNGSSAVAQNLESFARDQGLVATPTD